MDCFQTLLSSLTCAATPGGGGDRSTPDGAGGAPATAGLLGRGLHSSTFQLNLSRQGHLLVSPCLIDWGKTMHQTDPTKSAYVEPKSE